MREERWVSEWSDEGKREQEQVVILAHTVHLFKSILVVRYKSPDHECNRYK
jgi:hypothetical protein